MISLFIIMIVVLTLVSAAGYSVITFLKSSETMTMVLRNSARLDITGKLVEANLRTVGSDGVSYAPMGALVDGMTVVPAWVSVDAGTPWGTPYSYCPFAPPTGSGGSVAATVSQGNGGSYGVEVEPTTVDGAPRDYVVGGATASGTVTALGAVADDIVALIVSPTYGAASVPACSSVTYESGSFRVPGGSVVAVSSADDGSLAIGYETVSQICTSPATVCTAECSNATKKVLFGECLGGDTLSGFEAGTSPGSWTCAWAAASGPEITTRVSCANIR